MDPEKYVWSLRKLVNNIRVRSKLQNSLVKSLFHNMISCISYCISGVSNLPRTERIIMILYHCVIYGLQNDTLKKSYKRPPHIFSSSSESKIRSIKIHDQMNKPMSNSVSVSFCIPKCVISLIQTKHE